MNEDQILQSILASCFVKADVLRRMHIIREYIEQLFFTPKKQSNLTEFLSQSGASKEDMDVMKALGDDFFKSFTKENSYKLLDKVSELVKDIPIVNLYIPIEVGPEEVTKLGIWFRKNVDKYILIELSVDTSTLGGCAFAWNGVHTDLSLKHQMHSRKDLIRKAINEYTTK